MALFLPYVDESYGAGVNIYTVGAVVGTEEHWVAFNDAWKAILDKEGVPNGPGVPREAAFHSNKCAGGHGPTFGNRDVWPRSRRNDLMVTLADLTVTLLPLSVSTSVYREEYERIFLAALTGVNEPYKVQMRNPYVFCFQNCMEEIQGHAGNFLPQDDRIAPVLNSVNELYGKVAAHYAMLIKRPGWHRFADTFATVSGGAALPLDSVDLVAYESFRHMRDVVRVGLGLGVGPAEEMEPEHPAMKRLKQAEDTSFIGHFFDEPALLSLVGDLLGTSTAVPRIIQTGSWLKR